MIDRIEVVCPTCDTINRVYIEKLVNGVCGRCHTKLFLGKPLHLNEMRFQIHLRRNQIPIIVDFWAEWCPPCHIIAPILDQIALKLEPRIRIIKIETEKNKELAIRYGIKGIPTLILFKNGNEISRLIGAHDFNHIYAWITNHLFDS